MLLPMGVDLGGGGGLNPHCNTVLTHVSGLGPRLNFRQGQISPRFSAAKFPAGNSLPLSPPVHTVRQKHTHSNLRDLLNMVPNLRVALMAAWRCSSSSKTGLSDLIWFRVDRMLLSRCLFL